MGRELRSDGVRVAIFRQVLQNGQWVDAPISAVTVGEIENKFWPGPASCESNPRQVANPKPGLLAGGTTFGRFGVPSALGSWRVGVGHNLSADYPVA